MPKFKKGRVVCYFQAKQQKTGLTLATYMLRTNVRNDKSFRHIFIIQQIFYFQFKNFLFNFALNKIELNEKNKKYKGFSEIDLNISFRVQTVKRPKWDGISINFLLPFLT